MLAFFYYLSYNKNAIKRRRNKMIEKSLKQVLLALQNLKKFEEKLEKSGIIIENMNFRKAISNLYDSICFTLEVNPNSSEADDITDGITDCIYGDTSEIRAFLKAHKIK
jgi:predicted restriction endonuclease